MATTRDDYILGIFAENATTTIPNPPTVGVAYRNTATNAANIQQGWRTKTIEDMAIYNQILNLYSSVLQQCDSHGVPGWCDLVDYSVPAFVWGSDGNFYYAVSASGPNNGGAQDPVFDGTNTYWALVDFSASDQLAAELANENPGDEGDRLVGHTGETVYSAINNRVQTALLAASGASAGSSLVGGQFNTLFNTEMKARIKFAGATGAVLGTRSFNASVVRMAPGFYNVTLTNPWAATGDDLYVVGIGRDNTIAIGWDVETITASTVEINVFDVGAEPTGAGYDPQDFSLMCF